MEMGRKGRRWVEQNRSNARMADLVERRYLGLLNDSNGGDRGRSATTDAN